VTGSNQAARSNEEEVIEFTHKFDPQMFHLSRKSAERTIFKGLVARGWHMQQ
jgi:acyl dehydratase